MLRAFVPHVSVLSSPDCEELLRHKGINGGLLDLLRPFGERISGRVVIRDSTGTSKPWNDFGIRFTGVKDGLEAPRLARRPSSVGQGDQGSETKALNEYRPARLRSGGDVMQIDEVVERHLEFAEGQPLSGPEDYLNHKEAPSDTEPSSLFYSLYLRRMLSGLMLSPHETFSHPVAMVIAISSRNPSPIEELRTLYTDSNTGGYRLPPWVNNDFLRYYLLIHDEDYDDIKKSTALYEQMKRHFGLHCHLLRLRSTQCLASDDDSMRLPTCEWVSAGEELAEIVRREDVEDDEDPTPCIFESDAAAIRSFVREMVTQSIIPGMERISATWNDQVASRRRGISGRFMSLSKRFTPFAGRSVTGPASGGSGSNFDAIGGFYRPDSPEGIMRKLADYAIMLRDFKLASSTYDILCGDFKNDKAWKYYAGANEMSAITTLLTASIITPKLRMDTIDQALENAYYSYTTRSSAPFNAHRTLALGAELLRVRGGSSLDDAARWLSKIIEDRLVGPVGHALVLERIASCYSARAGVGALQSGSRKRKAAFWSVLAADSWLDLDKTAMAKKNLAAALALYESSDESLKFDGMNAYIQQLDEAANAQDAGAGHIDAPELDEEVPDTIEAIQQETEKALQPGRHRGLSAAGTLASFDPLGARPLVADSSNVERHMINEDGFE